MQIRVEQGKGKKDRYTLLSKKTLEILRVYIRKERPHFYLFEGQGSQPQKPVPYFYIHITTKGFDQIKSYGRIGY
ncbi:MAG: hypothetical protein WD426_11670 [Anditalea sp.]